jgi:membrane protease YdiL (CAAX protease family)
MLVVISQLVAPAFGLIVFSFIGRSAPPLAAFALAMLAYWTYLASVTTLIAIKDRSLADRLRRLLGPSTAPLFGALAFVPIGGAFFVAFLPIVGELRATTFLTAAGIGVVNGALEEIYWRGVTLASADGRDEWARYAAAATLFTIFHFAFLQLGLDYQGGALALVGGAAVMGVLWTLVAVKTQSVRPSIVAHQLVNTLAFSSLFTNNGL